MKLLKILQKELKQFPEGMFYAVQDEDGEVKFGKHSHPKLKSDGIWYRRESWDCLCITGLELAEDWDSAIVTKDMWESGRVNQIIVNVEDLPIEEKRRVNEALAKIWSVECIGLCNPSHWEEVVVIQGSSSGINVRFDYYKYEGPTHTPQQVLEMAGMVKQGHVHADLMALYAEDAKTSDKPWELWQLFTKIGTWVGLDKNPDWCEDIQYRRKPKTHTVNGVEVPDLRFVPEEGEEYWFPDAGNEKLVHGTTYWATDASYKHRVSNNLCYEPTEEGKQAAILHSRAWLGIA